MNTLEFYRFKDLNHIVLLFSCILGCASVNAEESESSSEPLLEEESFNPKSDLAKEKEKLQGFVVENELVDKAKKAVSEREEIPLTTKQLLEQASGQDEQISAQETSNVEEKQSSIKKQKELSSDELSKVADAAFSKPKNTPQVREYTIEAGDSVTAKRDPFSASKMMVPGAAKINSASDALNALSNSLQGSKFKFKADPDSEIPDIKLRGIVDSHNGERVVLLEVPTSGVFLVREGDSFSVNTEESKTVIKIKEISRLSVVVEAGTLGEVFIIR